MEKHYLFAIFHGALALTVIFVHGQDQSGFISIDCGALEDYKDETTGIYYTSDVNYTNTGESKNVSPQFSNGDLPQQYQNVRSFPKETKNCYTLNPPKGKNHSYLIRASFMYGNYDDENQFPQFDLYLGTNKWDTVKVTDSDTKITMEIIHVPQSDYLYVCLVNTNSGTPFISVLESRLLNSDTYVTQSGVSLALSVRLNCGFSTSQTVRYKNDALDRIWSPFESEDWDVINKSLNIATNQYDLPFAVMNTAATPLNTSQNLGFSWSTKESNVEFYLYLHFAELEKLPTNQTREFDIFINKTNWCRQMVPVYSSMSTVYDTKAAGSGQYFEVWINKTEKSTLPPILNALEIYKAKYLSQSQTDQNDVDAIMNIKSAYQLDRGNWQGDPCAPKAYVWSGLNCSYNDFDPPRVISLNLSSSGLTGQISPYISELKMIETLDMSNNNLSGTVPEFLSQLPALRVLNLERNNLSGTLPNGLQEKYKSGSILLRAEGNWNLCLTSECEKTNKKKKSKVVIPVVASVGGLIIVLSSIAAAFWGCKDQRKQADAPAMARVNVEPNVNKKDRELLEPKKQQFSYSEILSITNNFEQIIGKGGFGSVYLGYLNDTQVAVKMLSRSSRQGYKQFHAEAKILTRVYHRNLTALVGYCDEDPNLGLIYEYMVNGDLSWHLSDKNAQPLSWEERLKIAIDAAQGLEYLHCGCKPPIIHRDVKTTNILINEDLQAKICDFGLSRAFPLEGESHVSTVVVGTLGYLDPEYFLTNRLTEKSDVFSFGIVLLEIITGRFAITKNSEKDHIIEWVKVRLSNGDIKSIIDPRLLAQEFNKNSVWKVIELAMDCVSTSSRRRPNMTHVTTELKQCLAMEMATNNNSEVNESSDQLIQIMSLITDGGPMAR
ncbi:hypothetical protein UlMin_018518 [Ulmus minor]